MQPMRKALFALLLLVAAAAYGEQVAPAQEILAQGDSLTLSDGRVFSGWKIKRQTADSVFIQSAGGVGKIDKRLLPESLAAQFPYDQAAIAAEAAAMEKAQREADTLAANRAARNEWQRKRDLASAKSAAEKNQHYIDESDAKMAGYVKAAEAAPKIYAAKKAAREAELAKSFDGLVIDSVERDSEGLLIRVRNVAENPRILHRTDLVGITTKGELLEPGDVRGVGKNSSTLIDGGSTRSLLLVLPNWDCSKLQWKGRDDLAAAPVPAPARRR